MLIGYSDLLKDWNKAKTIWIQDWAIRIGYGKYDGYGRSEQTA